MKNQIIPHACKHDEHENVRVQRITILETVAGDVSEHP